MQCNAMQMQCNAAQRNATQCNAMQCSRIQYTVIEYDTIQYNSLGWHHITRKHFAQAACSTARSPSPLGGTRDVLEDGTSAIQYNTVQHNTIQYNAMECNTIEYNTMQYNTIQYTSQENTSHRQLVPPHGHPAPSVEQGMCSKMAPPPFWDENQRQSPTLEKTLCYARILAYGILRREPCHPAAAKEAKLSKSAALCEDTATPACRALVV